MGESDFTKPHPTVGGKSRYVPMFSPKSVQDSRQISGIKIKLQAGQQATGSHGHMNNKHSGTQDPNGKSSILKHLPRPPSHIDYLILIFRQSINQHNSQEKTRSPGTELFPAPRTPTCTLFHQPDGGSL